MKKGLSLLLSMALMMALFCLPSFAADSMQDSGQDSGIVIGTSGGKEIQLIGHVEPTIISVTMPSYIPFDISKSLLPENKVVSPKIDVTNNSLTPVTVAVDNTRIDLTQLPGVTWNSTGKAVGSTQIAVGFTESAAEPSTLGQALWLREGRQDLQLLRMEGQSTGTLYIVGSIGMGVPENKTFSVIPTLVVRKATT